MHVPCIILLIQDAAGNGQMKVGDIFVSTQAAVKSRDVNDRPNTENIQSQPGGRPKALPISVPDGLWLTLLQ